MDLKFRQGHSKMRVDLHQIQTNVKHSPGPVQIETNEENKLVDVLQQYQVFPTN